MSRLVTASLPPGWVLMPNGEAIPATVARNPTPMSPTWQWSAIPPGVAVGNLNAHVTAYGRTPQEAQANVIAQAWYLWFSMELDSTGKAEDVIGKVPPVPGTGLSGALSVILPPGYRFINADPLRIVVSPRDRATGYTRSVLIPGGVPGAGPTHCVQGHGPTPAAAVSHAIHRAWAHHIAAGSVAAQESVAPPAHPSHPRPATHVAREKVNPELCRSLPPGYTFTLDAPRYVAGKWHDTVTTPAGETLTGHVGEYSPIDAAKRVQREAWTHWRQLRGLPEPVGVDHGTEGATKAAVNAGAMSRAEMIAAQTVSAPRSTGKTSAMVGAVADALTAGKTVHIASPTEEKAGELVGRVVQEMVSRGEPAPVFDRGELKAAVERQEMPGGEEPAGDDEKGCPEEEAPDLTRQGLGLPPGYTFDCEMGPPPAHVALTTIGTAALRSYSVTGPGGVRFTGQSVYPGQARMLAAVRAWSHYGRTRRRSERGGHTVKRGPQLPPGYTWGEFQQQGNGWTLRVHRPYSGTAPRGSNYLTAHAPSKHGAIELGNRVAWEEHKRYQENGGEARPVPGPTPEEILLRTVRRHLTSYTIPPCASGETRAAAFVRILPPGYRHRDKAPVASAPNVSPTIYTDVVEHWSAGALTLGRIFQGTDKEAGTAATKAALLAWEHYERRQADMKRTERPGGVGSIGEEPERPSGRSTAAEQCGLPEPGPAPVGHGFRPGDRVRLRKPAAGQVVKYNRHVLETIRPGTEGTVVSPPHECFPPDAVQVAMDGEGEGAIQADLLQLLERGPDKMPEARPDTVATAVLPPGYTYGGEPTPILHCGETRWAQLVTTPQGGTLRGLGGTAVSAHLQAAEVAARHAEDMVNTKAARPEVCPLSGAMQCPAEKCPAGCPNATTAPLSTAPLDPWAGDIKLGGSVTSAIYEPGGF